MKTTNEPKRATKKEWFYFILGNVAYTYFFYWFVERGGI